MSTVSLYDAAPTKLLDLIVRENTQPDNAPIRNVEGAQPKGSNRQGAFGDGLHEAGAFKRMIAMCNVDSYTSVYHARAALEVALEATASVRFEGWSLPILRAVGIIEWQLVTSGFRAKINLIPSSAYWRYLTGPKSGTASQAAQVITGSGFAVTDVGRVMVWSGGSEALITSYTSATVLGSDINQTVASGSFSMYDAMTGLV